MGNLEAMGDQPIERKIVEGTKKLQEVLKNQKKNFKYSKGQYIKLYKILKAHTSQYVAL